MSLFEFQLILGDVDSMTEAVANALYEVGCDDGTAFSSARVAAVGFAREAGSLEEAIRSAVADVNRAGFRVSRVDSADESVFHKINQELARN